MEYITIGGYKINLGKLADDKISYLEGKRREIYEQYARQRNMSLRDYIMSEEYHNIVDMYANHFDDVACIQGEQYAWSYYTGDLFILNENGGDPYIESIE